MPSWVTQYSGCVFSFDLVICTQSMCWPARSRVDSLASIPGTMAAALNAPTTAAPLSAWVNPASEPLPPVPAVLMHCVSDPELPPDLVQVNVSVPSLMIVVSPDENSDLGGFWATRIVSVLPLESFDSYSAVYSSFWAVSSRCWNFSMRLAVVPLARFLILPAVPPPQALSPPTASAPATTNATPP